MRRWMGTAAIALCGWGTGCSQATPPTASEPTVAPLPSTAMASPAMASPAIPAPSPTTPSGQDVASNGLRCDLSPHDAELLAHGLVDEVLALGRSVESLEQLDRDEHVYLPPIETGPWHASIQLARGSSTDDTSHCQPNKLCAAKRIYAPGSFAMTVQMHIDPAMHLQSQIAQPPQSIGPLFVRVFVAGADEPNTVAVQDGVRQAVGTVELRYREACP